MIDSSPVTSSVSSATREFPKTTSEPGDDRKKRSATLQNSEASNSSSTHERPLAEIISEKFVPFDSVRYIVTPFEAELARDVTVDEEYTTMILEAVLHTHAWASARFKHKTQLECQKLEDQNSTILKTETEQGMCSPTPSSSTSASSFFPSFTSFHYGIIGIVGMATFAFKFCYEFYEKMREGLASFVTKMKKALAALTGVEA